MAICAACSGWGVVYAPRTSAPSTTEARLKERQLQKKNPLHLLLEERICMGCAGWGTRPSDGKPNYAPRRRSFYP